MVPLRAYARASALSFASRSEGEGALLVLLMLLLLLVVAHSGDVCNGALLSATVVVEAEPPSEACVIVIMY